MMCRVTAAKAERKRTASTLPIAGKLKPFTARPITLLSLSHKADYPARVSLSGR
jgi:hypothetical protein